MTVIKPQPADSQGHIALDVRISPKLGRELSDDINESVAHTQAFIMQTLPDRLIVTQKQFASLQRYTERMYETTDRMYITPYSVMEVIIDRDVDTIAEVEGAIQAAEELEALAHDHEDYPEDTTDAKAKP